MNRRGFLSAVTALAAVIPLVASAKIEDVGQRITVYDPPEPGFEHMGNRRFFVYCDGVKLESVVRVDTGANTAWVRTKDADGNIWHDGKGNTRETMVRGVIRLERIQ